LLKIKQINDNDFLLYYDFLFSLYRKTFSTKPFDLDVSKEYIHQFLIDEFNNGFIYIAFLNNLPVGFLTASFIKKSISGYSIVEAFPSFSSFEKNSLYLSSIAIKTEFKKQNIGNLLIKKVISNNKSEQIISRTRADTSEIHKLFDKNVFFILFEYNQKINNVNLPLYVWGYNF